MKFFAFFLLLFFLIPNLFASDKCLNASAQNEVIALKVGQSYQIRLSNSSTLIEGTFIGFEWKPDELRVLAYFQSFNSDKVISVPDSNIIKALPPEARLPGYINFLDSALEKALNKVKLSRVNPKKYNIIVPESKSVSVLSDSHLVDLGLSIQKSLIEFDSYLGRLSLTKPASTKVLISEKSFLSRLVGPLAFVDPNNDAFIHLSPVLFFGSFNDDQSVLFHERVHTFMLSTFSSNSVINDNLFLSEAIADFLMAHYRNDPAIGKINNKYSRGRIFVRNIERKSAAFSKGSEERFILTIDHFDSFSGHNNSLILSHFFWKLRKELGVEFINYRFKDILMELHVKWPVLALINGLAGGDIKQRDTVQSVQYSYYNFLAILGKISEDWPVSQTIQELISEELNEQSMSKETYSYLKSILGTAAANTQFDNLEDYDGPY